jgi:hypothetical protein
MSTTRQEFNDALDRQREFDVHRGEVISVALSIYCGHAASADGATTVQNALKKALQLIDLVESKVGDRPVLPDDPEAF